MVFLKTLCDDISSSDSGANCKAFSQFLLFFLCLATAITGLTSISSCFSQTCLLIPGRDLNDGDLKDEACAFGQDKENVMLTAWAGAGSKKKQGV
ncbi:hypothetical protein AVEN_15785-1 [Araneus ventricosus]|uniref:Uncharacterized protein n=1 Tax=Araneus ventricosus TaxID=182803 RepID=A0A4Y2PH94_ARAVE|nr:hypothetical protein AVEN_15785-1 [Araneus ventricosus]